MATCKDCMYYMPNGSCHRDPPRALSAGTGILSPSLGRGVWPLVLSDDWCGEYASSWRTASPSADSIGNESTTYIPDGASCSIGGG